MQLKKQTLDEWLDEVDYGDLNSSNYIPSSFALTFMNFIKLVNGAAGEANKTPPFHLKMLDKVLEPHEYIANVCFRGAAKALAVTTPMLTPEGWSTIGDLCVGDQVFGEDGKPTTITHKSTVFHKPMYRITLGDGRELDVSEDHINVVIHKRVRRVDGKCQTYYDRRELTTKELLDIPLGSSRPVTKKNPRGWENSVWVPLGSGIELPAQKQETKPYLLGLLLGGGSVPKDRKHIPVHYLHGSKKQRLAILQGLMDSSGAVTKTSLTFSSNSLQLALGVRYLVYSLGGTASLQESVSSSGKPHYRVQMSIGLPVSRLPSKLHKHKMVVKSKTSIESIKRIETVPSQCIAVDNQSKTFLAGDFIVTHNTTVFMEYFTLYVAVFGEIAEFGDVTGMIYVSDSMENGVKNARKNIETRYNNSEFLLEWLPKASFTDPYIEFENKDGHKLGVKLFGAKTGIRGSKIFAKRPTIAILDDLVSDDDSNSQAAMLAIKNTVYNGVNYALDPNKRKIMLNGTPFNKEDILVEAVESGGWHVNVWPVCEMFPCSREEFIGAWGDRFGYDAIKAQYDFAVSNGKVSGFMQELMLRISSTEERLVQDGELRWYSLPQLLKNRTNFNFYITTDFATSKKKRADFSVIFVWAYNANGDWYWVDGICERQTMDKNINKLFEFVQKYRPQSVGVEVSGQQGAFIQWLQGEMVNRNLWFNFASNGNSNAPGIRPAADKLQRFRLVEPWFKAGKFYFPTEMKQSDIIGRILQQLALTTLNGIKGKDDCIDGISQLAYMNPWKPADAGTVDDSGNSMWEDDDFNPREISGMSSYIV